MKLKIIAPAVVIVVITLIALMSVQPPPAGGAQNVLVVRNANSPVSCRIAAYYMSKRNIAAGNIVTISVPDSSESATNEVIALGDYLEKIEKPIREFLAEKKLTDKVQYIVLTKGVPIRISADSSAGVDGQSVDSVIATMDLVKPSILQMGSKEHPILSVMNRYWRSTEPFSHKKFGGYLVTRLDGYTEADAKALVDRALAKQSSPLYVLLDASRASDKESVARQPISLILPDGTGNRAFKLTYSDFDADMTRASEVIKGRPGLSVNMEQTKLFSGSDKPLTVYISWGSNANDNYSADTYHSLKFAPRSIVETAVSTSGRTFLATTGGQSLVADLIAQGAAGAKGYVTEPYLHAMASPTVLLDLYTSGRNLAESYYAASRFIGWKDIVLGDPLCSLDVSKGDK